MAYSYSAGEKKIRPGVYQRKSKKESSATIGALNGVVAFVMAANWGPVDKVTTHVSAKSIRETYGSGESVEAACAIFEAGASTVYIKRVNGTGGEKGTEDIGTAVTLTAKHPSSREIKVTVKAKASDATKKQMVVMEGTTVLETLEFASSSTDETTAFIEAVKNSAYIDATYKAAGVITAGDYELTGKNPTVTAANYAESYYALEPFRYNVLATDSIATDVFATLTAYKVESDTNGKLFFVVGGTDTNTDLTTRMANASACNNEGIIYLGSTWEEGEGNTVSGVKAVAYAAGAIAATPANKSIVHTSINGATDVTEKLTNAQYISAIQSGLLLVSLGPDGQVWFDSGINTLINPSDTQDEGWKKIRRVKTRYELMDRIDRTLAPKVGNINCDADGIAYIIQSGLGVIKDMIAEKKLATGSFYEDPDMPRVGDSAWFIIQVDDIDSLEKIYLHYQFRYSAN